MTIKHVMKDGTELQSIEGHVVKVEDVKEFYTILGRITKTEGKCYETNLEKGN